MQYPIWIGLFFALTMVCLAPSVTWWVVVAIGTGANGLVIAANGWKMPVRGSKEETVRHVPMTASTRHKWLADIIPVGIGTASIGDFFVAAGVMGAASDRQMPTYANLVILLGIAWWCSGWAKGFSLLQKWPAEVRRDARKNIPIVLLLVVAGNLLHVRGCGTSELMASVDKLQAAVATAPRLKPPAKAESKWRDLGTLAAPPPAFLHRLRKATAKQEREDAKQAAIKVTAAFTEPSSVFFGGSVSETSSRKGPFCRVTCAAHHGGQYDVETVPELCRSNWIPPTSYGVPGWFPVSDKKEITHSWPGPASAGFEKYKLYWSEIQSQAKVISYSRPDQTK